MKTPEKWIYLDQCTNDTVIDNNIETVFHMDKYERNMHVVDNKLWVQIFPLNCKT